MRSREIAGLALCVVLVICSGVMIEYVVRWAINTPNPAHEPRYADVGSLPDGRKVSYYRVWTPHETKYIYMVDGVPVEVK